MKNITRNQILSILLLSLLIVSCQFNRDKTQISENTTSKTIHPKSNEEEEIIAVLEKILIAVGNKNAQELGDLCTNKATIGLTYLQDDAWIIKELTVEEYLRKIVENKNPKPIAEIAEEYDISVTEDRLALIKAETIVSQFGVPKSREVNNMIMIKEKDDWKLLSIAWTVHPIPDEERKFDLNLFAHNYAQVWGSNRPEFVAMFFAKDGELKINNGKPAKGTLAITNVANGFMEAFPDMIVSLDSLETKSDKSRFYWTLIGTNNGLNGTGNKVKISGFEEWNLNDKGLIQKSNGYFDEKEYKRQLEFGTN